MASAIVLFAASLVSSSANAANSSTEKDNISKIVSMIPSSIVLEQTADLGNGKYVTVYYKKDGDNCEVYSECNLKGYSVDDLTSLRSTSFRIVSQPKGKRVYHISVAKARKIVKRLVNCYL